VITIDNSVPYETVVKTDLFMGKSLDLIPLAKDKNSA